MKYFLRQFSLTKVSLRICFSYDFNDNHLIFEIYGKYAWIQVLNIIMFLCNIQGCLFKLENIITQRADP